jgi:hypothetical protein
MGDFDRGLGNGQIIAVRYLVVDTRRWLPGRRVTA